MSTRKFVGLRIDIETRSGSDVTKEGAYRHSEDPDFAVLHTAYSPIYSYPGGATKIGRARLMQAGDEQRFRDILTDPGFQKHAFNANFERVCLSRWLGMGDGEYLDPINWHCSAVRANVNGVFGSLDEVARALRSPIAKDTEGKRLIRLFSRPDPKAGKFHKPGACWCGSDHTADFNHFGAYCCTDVETEAAVAFLTPDIPEHVQAEYEADQRINDRGVRHFKGLSMAAVAQVEVERDRLMSELKRLTGLDNPNSTQQMRRWLDEQDYPMTSLDKASRTEALDDPLVPEHVAEALVLKGAASLSSVSKHKAALNTRSADGRIRGSLRFYAAHTGREGGRGIQPQNLPRYEAPKADRARLLRGTAGSDAPTIAKGTARASLVPARGHVFVVCDYNSIESRMLGWLAGEKWIEDESRGAGKMYEATAAAMFGVDKDDLVESLKRCGKCGTCHECAIRARGKVSSLALQYAGGPGALVVMGAEGEGIDIGNYKDLHREWEALGKPGKFHEWNRDAHDYPELIRLRDLYRESSPMTARFWKLCAKVWDVAALTGQPSRFGQNGVLAMVRDGRHNRMVLPSGRSVWYRNARSIANPDRPDRIDRRTYIGKSKGVGHVRTDVHGGPLTNNCTQGAARDVLFDLMMKIEAETDRGYPARTVLHVHDEVVLEVPEKHAEQVLADTLGLMATPPDWAPGLAVKGEGAIMTRYGK